MPLAVYLEIGPKRTFAGAIEWPGWCRSGRGEEEALAALLAYAPRYGRVVKAAGLTFAATENPDVVERLTGGAGTDFGAPSVAPAADDRPLDAPSWTGSHACWWRAGRPSTLRGARLPKREWS